MNSVANVPNRAHMAFAQSCGTDEYPVQCGCLNRKSIPRATAVIFCTALIVNDGSNDLSNVRLKIQLLVHNLNYTILEQLPADCKRIQLVERQYYAKNW